MISLPLFNMDKGGLSKKSKIHSGGEGNLFPGQWRMENQNVVFSEHSAYADPATNGIFFPARQELASAQTASRPGKNIPLVAYQLGFRSLKNTIIIF